MNSTTEDKLGLINKLIVITTLVLVVYISLIIKNKLPPQIPLFYSRPWGEEQLTTPIFLLIPGGLIGIGSLVFTIVKNRIHDQILKRLVMGGIVVVELLLLLAVARVILVIG